MVAIERDIELSLCRLMVNWELPSSVVKLYFQVSLHLPAEVAQKSLQISEYPGRDSIIDVISNTDNKCNK